MKPHLKIRTQHFITVITDIVLCDGTRTVRALSLPGIWSHEQLRNRWRSCFRGDFDEPAIWTRAKPGWQAFGEPA